MRDVRPKIVRVKVTGVGEQQIKDVPEPEYDRVGGENKHPVCYVMGSRMQVEADMAASDDPGQNDLTKKTKIQVRGVARYGGYSNRLEDKFVDDSTEDWSEPDYDVLRAQPGNLPRVVSEFEDFRIEWFFQVMSWRRGWVAAYTVPGQAFSQVTEHVKEVAGKRYGLFLIWAPTFSRPDDFTMQHLKYACATARGARAARQVCNLIGPDATGGNRFSGDYTFIGPEAWRIVDEGIRADCGSLSWLMHLALELLGVDGSEPRYVYACHANWSHLWATSAGVNERHPELPSSYLGMWFGGPDTWNNYEGCCFDGRVWWRGGFGDTRRSALLVLHSVCDPNIDGVMNPHQAWRHDPYHAVSYPPGRP